MLESLVRKEKIMLKLKNGLINKGYSRKVLTGLNARLETIQDIKYKYSMEILNNLIKDTNYPLLLEVVHGLNNVCDIQKRRNDWFLYAINQDNISDIDADIIRECFVSKDNLIYVAEKSMIGQIAYYYIIFSKKKYDKSQEYINHKWQ